MRPDDDGSEVIDIDLDITDVTGATDYEVEVTNLSATGAKPIGGTPYEYTDWNGKVHHAIDYGTYVEEDD